MTYGLDTRTLSDRELRERMTETLPQRTEAAKAAAAELRRRDAERERERRAREWMERTFAQAKKDIADVHAISELAIIDDPEREPLDEEVRALIDRRYPDGNPYLNGTYDVI